ncbi:WD40/YVTN/BNR-like repeat-containing protein [Chloroflexota bacterium]
MNYLKPLVGGLPVLLLLVLVASCVPATSPVITSEAANTSDPPNNSPWEIILQQKIEQPLRVAAFFNESFGLTGGPSDVGQAYLTADGGDTWIKTENSADCLFSLDIVDHQVAWQCSLGPIRVSTDGAQTWQAVTDYGNYCRQLSFLDAETGWLAASNQLGMTTNGGQTWEAIPLPEGVQDIAAISLQTSTGGYLLDIAGVFYITQDKGQSWSSHPLALGLGDNTLPNHETAAAAVRFLDADHGLVVVHLVDSLPSKVVALRTADGGQTWTQENVITAPLLVSLYLSHDGSTLTMVDKMASQVTVLRYLE